jgi:O-methyltransferase
VGDLRAAASFMADSLTQTPVPERWRLVRRSYAISDRLEAPHAEAEVFAFMRAILSLPRSAEGVVVEAGCFKGASTAKFSLAAALAGRELVVFDSFQGIPAHDEPHDRDIFGRGAGFAPGDYRGELEEVRHNVTAWGDVSRCRFVPGWFEDTLPRFNEPILAAYLDVDLASSTRTCLKHLYPLIAPGGVLFSQDGHLPLVLEVFRDHAFWEHELGVQRPRVDGLGVSKLVRIVKPA